MKEIKEKEKDMKEIDYSFFHQNDRGDFSKQVGIYVADDEECKKACKELAEKFDKPFFDQDAICEIYTDDPREILIIKNLARKFRTVALTGAEQDEKAIAQIKDFSVDRKSSDKFMKELHEEFKDFDEYVEKKKEMNLKLKPKTDEFEEFDEFGEYEEYEEYEKYKENKKAMNIKLKTLGEELKEFEEHKEKRRKKEDK